MIIISSLNVLIILMEENYFQKGVLLLVTQTHMSNARLYPLFLLFFFSLFFLLSSLFPSRCSHFSNFGLLFSSSSNDDWTTYRIVSISLFFGTWVVLGLFILVVEVSVNFRVAFGFETATENQRRVLGEEE